jgi:hypothetical protein
MPLGLQVLLVVLGVTVVFAVVGYLIEKSAARNEQEGRH